MTTGPYILAGRRHARRDRGDLLVESGEIIAFLGADFIVTVRHGNHTGLRYLRTVLEATSERLRHGPTMVLHGIADLVVDNYVAVSESFGNAGPPLPP